jgi:phosphatidylglycerol:prolipoprotein diacylglycerol transferase
MRGHRLFRAAAPDYIVASRKSRIPCMFQAIAFPEISEIAFEIGPIAIRWYALSYVVALLIGWRYCIWLSKRTPRLVSSDQLDDFFLWAIVGVVLGGRIGFVLFYNPLHYLTNPLDVFVVWRGGMSFHGGLVGVILAMILFAWRRKLPFFALSDIVAAATPIGLFLGRLANFVNGELYGRATDVPWAMIFPNDEAGIARHPSQLYQAALEGVVLFVLLLLLSRSETVRKKLGTISGTFLAGYALARIAMEFFREPDAQLGFLIAGTTMGQWLSVPMLLYGTYLIVSAKKTA